MQKFLGTAMCAALVFGAIPAKAEILKNFKANGGIDIQGRAVNNRDYNVGTNDFSGQTDSRISVEGSFDLSDEASARVTVVKNDGSAGTGATTLNAAALTSPMVQEANITLKGVFGWDHTIGRMYYGAPGDLIARFGPTAGFVKGLGVSNIEGLKATKTWDDGKYAVTALIAKMALGGAVTPATFAAGDLDTDLAGVEFACTHNAMANMTARVYQAKSNNSTVLGETNNAKAYVAGISAKGDLGGGLTYQAEFAKNFGKTTTVDGTAGAGHPSASGMAFLGGASWMGDIGAGKFGANGQFGYGSGDDDATDGKDKKFGAVSSDYRPGMIFGGGFLSGGVGGAGIGNLTTLNAGAKFSPAGWEKLWLGAQGYTFSKTKTAAASKSIGKELDVTATWQHSENISVKFGWAMFKPGDNTAVPPATQDAVKMTSADFNVRF